MTYESNGATAGSPPVAQNKDFNSPLILSGNTGGLTKTGHTFNGWNTATDGSGTAFAEGAIYSENASAILYASWLLNQYTITFDSNGGSALATITANFGSTLTAPANPTRERYTFAGWNPAFPESMPASDTTLTAHWELNTFTVRFLDWDETLLQVLQIPDGEAVVLPLLPEREGFRFIGWSEDLGSITSDLDVRALYEELSFEVSVSVSGAAIVTPDRQMVLYGRHATFALNHTNADDVVVVNSDCGASYHAGEIITAPIVAGCSIDVTVYAPVQVEADSTAPGPINQIRPFTVLGGSGEQHLLEADLTRAGRVVPMTEYEINMTLTHLEDGSYRFAASRTGRYSFRFVDDSSGQVVEISFDVLPYLAFASSRQQTEPELATQLSVWLSDEAIFYPVSATLVANDVALNSQVVNIQLEDRLQQNLTATATSDATIWLEADSIVNALPGTPENHRLVVVEEPAPLSLLATALQQDEATLVINRRNGMVLLSVEEQTGVGVSFSWSANGLPLQVDAAQASFDPQNVQLGDYSVLITATDGRRTGQYTLTLRVIDGCNFDSCATISGIPAERNSLRNSRNRLPICPIVEMVTNRVGNCQDQDLLFAEVPLLYTLALGIFSGNTSWSSDQFGLALNDGSLPDEGFTQVGYKVNLDILGLLVPGESVPVMIPLPVGTSIPQDAVWRKFTTMQWHDFVEDENNVLQSAARDALGQCPVVSSDVWEDGLVAGYGCIRLIIEDGGPNDDDAIANGVIRDPGVLAIRNRYTLTFNPNGGSAVAPVTQLFGSALNIAPPVREGHTFIGWSPALPETIPSNNATYTAQWQVNAYQIRFNTAGGQELAPLWVNFGNPIVAPVPVRQGYRFKGWNPSLPATMPAGDLQVTAQWCESEEQLTSKGGSMHVLWLVGLGILAWLRKSRLGLVWLAVQPGNR
ncbi:InlB B-repeat-containing protein [Alkalimonas sp. NCh-2]|uniref:InlB B-repeat-containing protein n=1 Tax=Alkalimonas sp. NCh-2 TaxID=3144846 RepID=UPI0031F6EAD3